jgi:glycosyltransferase involved in cell wall biosynthesis
MEPPVQEQWNNAGLPANPLVSIVVATYNRGPFLERCLRSILDQTYGNIECIVVDGASKDESIEILKRLAARDPRLKFISEPDEGEVYAVNKGLDLATGDIVGFQASDDLYVPDAVAAAVDFLRSHPESIGVSGDALYVDEKGRSLGRGVITYRGPMRADTIRHIIRVRYKMCPVCHGSFFGRRKRLLQYGKLDPAFSVTPDWEYYFRILKAGEQIGCLPRVQYLYTAHVEMGAVKYWAKVEAQRRKLYEIHNVNAWDVFVRATAGRLASYLSNPYRTPFLPGLWQELRMWWAQRKGG